MNLRTLSVTEAVNATGFSRDRIYELVRDGAVAVIRSAGKTKPRIRIIASSLEDWMTRASSPARPPKSAPTHDADREIPSVDSPLFS